MIRADEILNRVPTPAGLLHRKPRTCAERGWAWRRQIVALLAECPRTRFEIEALTGASTSAVKRHLREIGLTDGKGGGGVRGRPKLYRLPEGGRDA